MLIPTRAIAAVLVAACLAGCVGATAVPLDRDVWRLQVPFEPAENPATVRARILKEAAAVAFNEGYPFFLLEPARTADPGAELGRALLIGQTRGLPFVGPAGGTATAAVTVLLLTRDDPRASGAYDMLKVLNP